MNARNGSHRAIVAAKLRELARDIEILGLDAYRHAA
jgi:hypothetical protein